MLKISQVEPVNHSVTLRLEGRIIGPWVTELSQTCEQVLVSGRPLTLQLADVEFMDGGGVALLTALRSRGVSITDLPPFIAEQLKATDVFR